MAIKPTPKAVPLKSQSTGAPAKVRAPYKPSQEEIAARAFEIFKREGGADLENWLRAERELLARGPR